MGEGLLVRTDWVKAPNHHVEAQPRQLHGVESAEGVAVYSGESPRLAFRRATHRRNNSDSAVSHSWFHVHVDSGQTRSIPSAGLLGCAVISYSTSIDSSLSLSSNQR